MSGNNKKQSWTLYDFFGLGDDAPPQNSRQRRRATRQASRQKDIQILKSSKKEKSHQTSTRPTNNKDHSNPRPKPSPLHQAPTTNPSNQTKNGKMLSLQTAHNTQHAIVTKKNKIESSSSRSEVNFTPQDASNQHTQHNTSILPFMYNEGIPSPDLALTSSPETPRNSHAPPIPIELSNSVDSQREEECKALELAYPHGIEISGDESRSQSPARKSIVEEKQKNKKTGEKAKKSKEQKDTAQQKELNTRHEAETSDKKKQKHKKKEKRKKEQMEIKREERMKQEEEQERKENEGREMKKSVVERKEREMKEREMREREMNEREMREREKKEKEMKEKEKNEREKKEREKKEREKKEREMREREKKEKEMKEKEKNEREKNEKEKKEREKKKKRKEEERNETEMKQKERKEIEKNEKKEQETKRNETKERKKIKKMEKRLKKEEETQTKTQKEDNIKQKPEEVEKTIEPRASLPKVAAPRPFLPNQHRVFKATETKSPMRVIGEIPVPWKSPTFTLKPSEFVSTEKSSSIPLNAKDCLQNPIKLNSSYSSTIISNHQDKNINNANNQQSKRRNSSVEKQNNNNEKKDQKKMDIAPSLSKNGNGANIGEISQVGVSNVMDLTLCDSDSNDSDSDSDVLFVYPIESEKDKLTVRIEDWERLMEEGEFLNDVIIELYLKLMRDQKSKEKTQFFLMGTYFHSTLVNDHAKVLKWMKNTPLYDYDYLLVPVHIEEHWILVVVYLGMQARIYVLDSFRVDEDEVIFNNFEKLRLFLEESWYSQESTTRNFSSEAVPITFLDVTQQDNHYECGFFLLNFAKSWVQYLEEHKPRFLPSNEELSAKINFYLKTNTTEYLRNELDRKIRKLSRQYKAYKEKNKKG